MGPLTIGLTGDVMLGRTLNRTLSEKGYDYPWGNVLPLMKNTDFNIINLETSLTNCERKVNKTFNFKSSPDKVQSLINANVTLANLANNHILDFEIEGLLETLETLDKAGIKYVGAGKDRKEAIAPVVLKEKNIRIGILGLTDNEPEWKASVGPGTNYINLHEREEKAEVLHAIERLREETDFIFVSVHWGPNMRQKPTTTFTNFAHAMIDCGANIIHGHSAHILQGIERYNNNLILYDLGDFVDDYVVDPYLRNDLSAFFIITLNPNGLLNLRCVPVRISNYQVNLGQGEDREWVIRRLQYLSSDFGTIMDEQGKIILNSL